MSATLYTTQRYFTVHYNGAKKYKSSSKTRGGQYHPEISIEGPIMTAPPAAPGAASMVSGGGGGPAAAAVVLTSSKRTSSNMDRDSQVFREEEEEGLWNGNQLLVYGLQFIHVFRKLEYIFTNGIIIFELRIRYSTRSDFTLYGGAKSLQYLLSFLRKIAFLEK